ncbi:MAG TPA: leucyl aminopeptidase [Ktedonobacteraceae bacterium]|nr:leucyl aminopeptidase [Ktedonobacteraceae bacterium]
MDIRITNQAVKEVPCDALVVGAAYKKVGQQAKDLVLAGAASEVDNLLGGLIHTSYAGGEFNGDRGALLTLHPMDRLAAKRVIVVGLGSQEKIDSQVMRRASAIAARHLQQTGAHQVVFALQPEELDLEESVCAEVEGALFGLYTFKKYKHSGANGHGITSISLLAGAANDTALNQAIEHGAVLAEATNFARDLVNEPPGVLTPSELANRAGAMARQFGLEYEIVDRPRMQELGMGGLLAVAQGSAEPPKFIILRYRGAPQSKAKGIALVGKGITFDSGGLSLKTAEQMQYMKTDMAGAAAVVGAMYAIAALKPAINVTALVPATENMPGAAAYRPGDILRLMNGTTIEIINTDAEGRLVLADALSYAVEEGLSPIIDVATLTGGITVALGSVMSGLFCNDQALSNEIIAAGQVAGEKFWPMPLDEEYEEDIQSDVADIKQTGGRAASSAKAAKILEHFVGDSQWAHLDIAGTDYAENKKPYQEKGATGVAVRTLAEFVLRRAR